MRGADALRGANRRADIVLLDHSAERSPPCVSLAVLVDLPARRSTRRSSRTATKSGVRLWRDRSSTAHRRRVPSSWSGCKVDELRADGRRSARTDLRSQSTAAAFRCRDRLLVAAMSASVRAGRLHDAHRRVRRRSGATAAGALHSRVGARQACRGHRPARRSCSGACRLRTAAPACGTALCRYRAAPLDLRHRSLRRDRREHVPPCDRSPALDVLDRRRHGVVRQRPPLPERRHAAARGCRPRRGADQLLPLFDYARRAGRGAVLGSRPSCRACPWNRAPPAGARRPAGAPTARRDACRRATSCS